MEKRTFKIYRYDRTRTPSLHADIEIELDAMSACCWTR